MGPGLAASASQRPPRGVRLAASASTTRVLNENTRDERSNDVSSLRTRVVGQGDDPRLQSPKTSFAMRKAVFAAGTPE